MLQQTKAHQFQEIQSKYFQLQKQFLHYKQQSIVQKQQMKKQIQKHKQTLQKFISKLDKRVDSRINQQRLLNNYHLQKQQQLHKQQLDNLKLLLTQKQKMIQQMRSIFRSLELQKKQLIQHNTKMLVQISHEFQNKDQKSSFNNNNSKELLKMYQYLIQENNQLKKEIYILRKNNINQSFHVIKEENSLLSEPKDKYHTVISTKSKGETNKSIYTNGEGKQKNKKNKPKATNK